MVDVESEERIGVRVPFGTSPFVVAAGCSFNIFDTFNDLLFSYNQVLILPSEKPIFLSFCDI